MLTNILTLACGLGLAYVFLIIIDSVRTIIVSKYRYRKSGKKRPIMKSVYNYQNKQVEQPVKEDKRKK